MWANLNEINFYSIKFLRELFQFDGVKYNLNKLTEKKWIYRRDKVQYYLARHPLVNVGRYRIH